MADSVDQSAQNLSPWGFEPDRLTAGMDVHTGRRGSYHYARGCLCSLEKPVIDRSPDAFGRKGLCWIGKNRVIFAMLLGNGRGAAGVFQPDDAVYCEKRNDAFSSTPR